MRNYSGLTSRLNAWLLSKGTDSYNQRVDHKKEELFSGLSGRVLEIGPGTGANLAYYPKDILLIGLEPNPFMQNYFNERAQTADRKIEIITGTAESIPLDDESVDTVVSTLVLCSVENLSASLAEIKRVLKPGGVFLFIEHVAAPAETSMRKVQGWVKPFWKFIAGGCNPAQETGKAIGNAGFSRVESERFRLSLAIVGPHLMGKAIK